MKFQSTFKITLALAAGLVTVASHAADTNTSASDGGSTDKSSDNSYSSQSVGVAFLQNITIAHGGGLIQWSPGPKVDLCNGWNITKHIGAEFQYGFAYNGMSRVDGQSVSNGNLWTVPLMLNGNYNYAFNDHWRIYGGLGGGALISVIGTAGPAGQTYTDCEFGYQAILGVQYHFTEKCVFGMGYGFLGSLDHHFNTTTSPTYMHSIMLSLSSKW